LAAIDLKKKEVIYRTKKKEKLGWNLKGRYTGKKMGTAATTNVLQ
jgi:hypothetical protein